MSAIHITKAHCHRLIGVQVHYHYGAGAKRPRDGFELLNWIDQNGRERERRELDNTRCWDIDKVVVYSNVALHRISVVRSNATDGPRVAGGIYVQTSANFDLFPIGSCRSKVSPTREHTHAAHDSSKPEPGIISIDQQFEQKHSISRNNHLNQQAGRANACTFTQTGPGR